MLNRGLRRSITDFRRHPWLHLISISTITVALLILGTFFLCYRNFEALAEKTSPQVTGTVYLKDGLTKEQLALLTQRVLSVDQVENATFKTKQSVVEELQTFLGGAGLENLPGNELFPDVLELQLKQEAGPAALAVLKSIISKFPEVTEVDFSEDWLAQYKRVRQVLRVFGFLLLVGCLVGCTFIIANFMGMRHQSRKSEIDIVRLIGAHQNFVLGPFLWEGLIEGVIGSTIALSLLYFLKLSLATLISVQWSSLLGVQEWLYLSPAQLLATIGVGVLMAFCGGFTVFMRFRENNAR